jgi:hypothetical protein
VRADGKLRHKVFTNSPDGAVHGPT